MVRVTIEQVGKVMQKLNTPEDEPRLKKVLKYWFSFPENIDTYSKFCFPTYILGVVPDFHKEFYEFLLDKEDGALAAPRGHGKSTVSGLVFISWNLVNQKEKYIVYISQNHAKTVQFIEPISTEFKTNNRLRWLYGDMTPKRNADESGRDREDCIDINGCRVEALSFEKNIRGIKYGNKRPTLIIGDDIEDDQRVLNDVLRNKDHEKLNKAIIPSLDIEVGRFKMIGTILHLNSLLMKKIKAYDGKIYKAEDEDGNILWKEYFTRERLDKKKRSIGSVAYQQEYLNNPVDNETAIIKSEWIRQCFDYEYDENTFVPDELYLGVDFAFSDRVSADKSVFMDIALKDGKKVPIRTRWRSGMSVGEQMTLVKSLHESMRYNTIAFEENSIKGNVKDIRTLSLPIRMFWTGSRDAQGNDKYKQDTYSTSYSKLNAITRLGVEFENKMWRIPYRTEKQQQDAESLLSELTSWAQEDGKLVELGVHPDAPICMILVNELLSKPAFNFVF